MRQAGRYLPEYMEISKKYSFFEMSETPEIAKEITLQPIKRFDLDFLFDFNSYRVSSTINAAEPVLIFENIPLRFQKIRKGSMYCYNT